MESWSYVSEGKGSVSDEINSPSNSLARNRHFLFSWESRNPQCNFNNNMISDQYLDNQGIGKLNFPEMVIKQLPENSMSNVLSSKIGAGRIVNNAYSGEDVSTLKISSIQESSLIDLKLGRFSDKRDVHSSKFSKKIPIVSSLESSTAPKRVRAPSASPQTTFCQVYGCNKDLSSSKDYHKRHKVCEIHSKTAKVIVDGIEQRFCQQCSRFHLLVEFDDGKRSCRKRLAGHNERRRKPIVGITSGRTGRLLNSYNGSRFHVPPLTAKPFSCQEILPTGLLHTEKYKTDDLYRLLKVEDKNNWSPPSSIPIANSNLHSKSMFLPCIVETQFPQFSYNAPGTTSENTFNETTVKYPHNVQCRSSNSHYLFHDTSFGSDDSSLFYAPSAIEGLSSDSSCALSLLSSQPPNSSTHSSGIPVARPLVIPDGRSQTHYSMSQLSESQISEKLVGMSPRSLTSGISNKFASSWMNNSAEGCQLGPLLSTESSDGVKFGIMDQFFNGSNMVNDKDRVSQEDGATIDLLQLSSQFERVKQ